MKSAGKEMTVGGAGLRGGWAVACDGLMVMRNGRVVRRDGGWASGLVWVLGRGSRALSGGGRVSSGGSRAATAIVALAAGVMVTGCGGGGGDEGPAASGSAAASTEKPVEQPILTMPTSTYTGMHAEAFKRINEARIAAGVSALKQSVELDRAAQAHSDYLVANNVLSHNEDSTAAYFTGSDASQRATAKAYKNVVSTEVIAQIDPTRSGRDHIDMHLNSVYHLHGILMPQTNEVGIGLGSLNSYSTRVTSSITLGTTDSRMRSSKDPFTWPVHTATEVPSSFAPSTEVPNPLAGVAANNSVLVGPPIMFCRSVDLTYPWALGAIAIQEADQPQASIAAWVLKPAYLVTNTSPSIEFRSDSRLGRVSDNCIFLITKMALRPATQYTVGVVTIYRGTPSETRWSFTTAN